MHDQIYEVEIESVVYNL